MICLPSTVVFSGKIQVVCQVSCKWLLCVCVTKEEKRKIERRTEEETFSFDIEDNGVRFLEDLT